MLRLFNTMTRRKEAFRPRGREVKLYTCGPSVYDSPHVGNHRTYVWEDVLKRYLEYLGYRVRHAMNITDVEDKAVRTARQEGISLRELTGRHERAFFKDVEALNMEPADFYPRATEHIRDMVALVKRLLEKGMAYRPDGDIYFDLSKARGYGTLARLRRAPKGRVSKDDYERREAGDFILWKAHRRQDGDVYWETELGKGRPGWSIQCSAMAMRYLGPTIDIHTGGIDNIFSHNENEIAQSEGATGKRFVRYWLHARHLYVDGRKMSKSLGNYHTLSSLMEMGYDPRAVRYLLLSVHYRRRLDFTLAKMERSQRDLEALLGCIELLEKVKGGRDDLQVGRWIREAEKRFRTAMDDDLDTPAALQALTELASKAHGAALDGRLSRRDARKVLRTLPDFDRVLGFLKTQNSYKLRR